MSRRPDRNGMMVHVFADHIGKAMLAAAARSSGIGCGWPNKLGVSAATLVMAQQRSSQTRMPKWLLSTCRPAP